MMTTISTLEMTTDMRTKKTEETLRGYRPILTAAACIAAAACVMRICARRMDGWSDLWRKYTNDVWVNVLGRISNVFPFSLAEFLIYGIIIFTAIFFVHSLILAVMRKGTWKAHFARGMTGIIFLAAVIFFLYEGGEDVYFYCTPFSEIYGYGSGSYSTEELTEVCGRIARKCNEYAPLVERDKEGLMILGDQAGERVRQAMEDLGETYSLLGGWYPKAKGVFFSRLMSKTSMAGIYSAYTSEANYNTEMTPYNIPFTMSHELSHLKGVLPENEANFTAYLGCIHANDPDLVYSGYITGWIYCGNELYKRDKTAWRTIALTLSESVNADLDANTAFWAQFKGKAAEKAEKFNDAYLKQAGQSSGVESYNEVTDLVVSYEEKQLHDII